MGNPRFGKWNTDNHSLADHEDYNGFGGYSGNKKSYDKPFKKYIDISHTSPEEKKRSAIQREERRNEKNEKKLNALKSHIEYQKQHTHYYKCDEYVESVINNAAEVTCEVCKAKISKLNIHAGVDNFPLCTSFLKLDTFFIRPSGHQDITCKTCLRITGKIPSTGKRAKPIHYCAGGCDTAGKQWTRFTDEVTCPDCLEFIRLNKIANVKDFPDVPTFQVVKTRFENWYEYRCPTCGRVCTTKELGQVKSPCRCWMKGIIAELKK